jgi:hypothetical protein
MAARIAARAILRLRLRFFMKSTVRGIDAVYWSGVSLPDHPQ